MKLHHRIVDAAGRLVPRRLRPEWLREWRAELAHREARRTGLGERARRWDLVRRSAGSVWDALAMQPRRLEEDVYQDVRYGLRTLWRNKGWTGVVVLSLAFGIGANTALFSLIDAALLRPLPVTEPDRLVFFEGAHGAQRPYVSYSGNSRREEDGGAGTSFPYLTFERFRAESETLSDVAAFAPVQATVRIGDFTDRATAQVVSGSYFAMLGVPTVVGRTLTDADDQPAAEPAAVISHGYWQRQFGEDPAVIGRSIVLNGVPVTVVGVGAPEFSGALGFGTTADISAPLALEPRLRPQDAYFDRPWYWWLRVMGRMQSGVDEDVVRAELERIFQATALDARNAVPASAGLPPVADWEPPRLRVRPGGQGIGDPARNLQPLLMTLLAVFGLLLLIVCLNVANLLVARLAGRRREIGLRLAVGAGRLRLVRQFMTENIVLALGSGGLGVALAYWGKGLLARALAETGTTGMIDLRLDGRVLAFLLGVSFVTAVVFGLAPAFRSVGRLAAQAVVRDGGRNPTARSRFSRGLMAAQVAVSMVLLTGAGLFLRTLDNLRSVAPGFNTENLLLFGVSPQTLQYDEARIARLYEDMLREIEALPGIVGATRSEYPLASGASSGSTLFVQDGEPSADGRIVRMLRVQPNFLATMEIPVVRGRDLAATDDQTAPRVALINETLAHAHFPGGDPLGRTLGFGGADRRGDYEIVGVVRDVQVGRARQASPPAVYLSILQRTAETSTFEVRTRVDPLTLAPLVRETIRRIDPNVPVLDLQTQVQYIESGYARERLLARASAIFGVVALLLASIGLYGLISHNVTSRIPEIGVRMALGARRRQVIGLILRETSRMVLVGVALGLAGVYGASRFIASFLFGVEPNDPATIAAAVGLLIATAAAAALLPARRASRVEPMAALRHE